MFIRFYAVIAFAFLVPFEEVYANVSGATVESEVGGINLAINIVATKRNKPFQMECLSALERSSGAISSKVCKRTLSQLNGISKDMNLGDIDPWDTKTLTFILRQIKIRNDCKLGVFSTC